VTTVYFQYFGAVGGLIYFDVLHVSSQALSVLLAARGPWGGSEAARWQLLGDRLWIPRLAWQIWSRSWRRHLLVPMCI